MQYDCHYMCMYVAYVHMHVGDNVSDFDISEKSRT